MCAPGWGAPGADSHLNASGTLDSLLRAAESQSSQGSSCGAAECGHLWAPNHGILGAPQGRGRGESIPPDVTSLPLCFIISGLGDDTEVCLSSSTCLTATFLLSPPWWPTRDGIQLRLFCWTHSMPVLCPVAMPATWNPPSRDPPRPWWQRSGCPESEQLSGDANMNSNIGTRDPDLKVNVHEKFLGICLVRHTTPHTVSGWALVLLPSSSECSQHLSPCEYGRRPHEALPGGELEDSSPCCVIDVQPSPQPRHLHPCHSVVSNSLQPHGL